MMSENPETPPPLPARARRRRAKWATPLLFLLAAAIVAGPQVHLRCTPKIEAPAPEPDGDAPLRQRVVGTWEDDHEGKRTMTVRPDGTATMVVELSGLKALLSAKRLQFEMEWSIEDGRLKKRTVGGEPAAKVNAILRMMGDRVDEPILELTEKRLLLLDKDGRTKYDWRRVE